MRLIDANVFIYASGAEHEYKAPSVRALDRARSGEIDATTDVEALQEILHYYHRQGVAELGAGVVGNALIAFPSPFPITGAIVSRASSVLMDHSDRLAARDAIHAAVVLEHRLEGIISADRGFDAIPGVMRFDPRDI